MATGQTAVSEIFPFCLFDVVTLGVYDNDDTLPYVADHPTQLVFIWIFIC